MRSHRPTLLLIALLFAAVFAPRIGANVGAASAAALNGFGAIVLVGDGEVYVGESANQFRSGMVYVYRKTNGAWREAATITGPNSAVSDGFGSSLATDGTRLFVGAGTELIHVFARQAAGWSLAGTIAATSVPNPAAAAAAPAPATTPANPADAAAQAAMAIRFGNALAAAGDWLLVGKEVPGGGRGRGGAAFAGAGGGRGAGGTAPALPPGAVYAFKRGSAGLYSYHSTLAAADAAASAGDNFGSAVTMTAEMALIGANGQTGRAGVVHEFGLDADGAWKSQRTFAPIGVQGNEMFGSQIAMTGDQAVVTAPGDAGGYGAAYVFRRVAQVAGRGRGSGGAPPPPAAAGAPAPAPAAAPQGNFTWQEITRLAAPAGLRQDGFATALAADASQVWVSAPRAAGPGRVFVFTGNADGFKADGLQLLGPTTEDPAAAGVSLSLKGNVAAVGATGVNRNAGGLLIYERDGSGAWREQPMLITALDELPAFTGSERRCTSQGKIEMFECGAADLMAFLPPSRLTWDGHYIPMSSLWGWTDSKTKQEWAIMGRRDGATFVDITSATKPIVVADLPLTEGARPSSWREIKVYKDHAYIVSDAAGPHGIQIVDLTRLRTMKPQPNGQPQKIEADLVYRNVNSVHDIVINEDSGFMYAVGSSGGGTTCGGGLHMVDIREPKNPKFVGCYADVQTGRSRTGYSHDAVCVTYKGPDKRYKGHEICVGSNETAISLADVTDHANPKFVSRATYPNVGYTHQGWFDEDHRYFYVDDETDEGKNGIDKTRTLIWDFVDLENPRLVKEHFGVTAASDHNLYIKGELMYQADYRAGLRILSIKDRVNPKEIAFFKTDPYRPNTPGFNGAWNVYPFFKSGLIIVSSIEQGLFIIRTADK
jgi:choice-of-anchor B domain-containing protein